VYYCRCATVREGVCVLLKVCYCEGGGVYIIVGGASVREGVCSIIVGVLL